MLVDSNGSRKPPASPSATQFPCHSRVRRPVRKAKQPRLGQGRSVQTGKQPRGRFIVRQMRRGIDDAIAGTVLKRDTPLPSRTMRGRAGIGRERPGPLRRHRDSRSLGSQCPQSSNPTPSVSPSNSARKPEQSRKRSPAIRVPSSITIASIGLARHFARPGRRGPRAGRRLAPPPGRAGNGHRARHRNDRHSRYGPAACCPGAVW